MNRVAFYTQIIWMGMFFNLEIIWIVGVFKVPAAHLCPNFFQVSPSQGPVVLYLMKLLVNATLNSLSWNMACAHVRKKQSIMSKSIHYRIGKSHPGGRKFNQGLGKPRPWLKFLPLGGDFPILHGHSWWILIFLLNKIIYLLLLFFPGLHQILL